MGSNRKLLLGGLLVVAGLLFWGLISFISRIGTGNSAPPPPAMNVATGTAKSTEPMIAYTTADIPAGAIMTREMFTMRRATGDATGFMTDPSTQGIGYITRVRIPKNTQVRPDSDFIGHISEVGIAGALGVGKRAMVIPLANKPTLHDLVHIGNFVDVNAAFDGQEARSIVQNVRVLAVDVFGSDFPQVNIAARGPYRADDKGSQALTTEGSGGVTASGAPVAAGTTPTATPAPGQAPPRPDAAITLEVTPEQANTILLAQASSATIDFVVRPALPGGASADISPLEGGGTPIEGTNGDASLRSVSVTKAQIAPYAERHKTAGSGNGTRNASGSGSGAGSSRGSGGNTGSRRGGIYSSPPLPDLPPVSRGDGGGSIGSMAPASPGQLPQSPTYDIPIYSDGKGVRVDTVRRPQEPSASFHPFETVSSCAQAHRVTAHF